MIKKLLSVILCFCMAAVLLPFAAFAETGAQAGMPELTVNDTVKTVFFGGYEFYVIDYKGVGVHSAKNDNTVTLFMR